MGAARAAVRSCAAGHAERRRREDEGGDADRDGPLTGETERSESPERGDWGATDLREYLAETPGGGVPIDGVGTLSWGAAAAGWAVARTGSGGAIVDRSECGRKADPGGAKATDPAEAECRGGTG